MIRAIDKWLTGYVKSVLQRRLSRAGFGSGSGNPKHLMFCLADHFEPFRGCPGAGDEARKGVKAWVEAYPETVRGCLDADGRPPRHTFFYPQEEYDAACLDSLASLCTQGLAEVEIHLHHRNDTPDGFRAKLIEFRDVLRGVHGLLGSDTRGDVRYGFVHGNWALCNSRPDGDWCGVDEELGILQETGCYADFTYPSAPSATQPRMVNAIYYAHDVPGKPRGHDRGVPVAAGHGPAAVAGAHRPLMLVQGPLALDWRARKWGIMPRIENGAIAGVNPPSPARIDTWIGQHIHVKGREEWVFVKVHTHGCVGANRDVLLGDAMRQAHDWLLSEYNDGSEWVLHYVSARELYNIVRAAQDGMAGNPGVYRDYEIAAPSLATVC